MSVQFIENNGQRQYAVVPIDVYNDLLEKVEMLENRAAYEKAKQDDDELIPGEVVYRLLDGENKIKVWREYRQMTDGIGGKIRHGTSNHCPDGRRKAGWQCHGLKENRRSVKSGFG